MGEWRERRTTRWRPDSRRADFRRSVASTPATGPTAHPRSAAAPAPAGQSPTRTGVTRSKSWCSSSCLFAWVHSTQTGLRRAKLKQQVHAGRQPEAREIDRVEVLEVACEFRGRPE